MAANGGTGTEEHKRKARDCFQHRNMSISSRMCTSMRKDLPENFPNNHEIDNEDKHLTKCLTSPARFGPPSTRFCSTTGDEHIVEELTARDYKNPNLALLNYPLSSRQPQRNLLGDESRYTTSLSREIVPQDEENMPVSTMMRQNTSSTYNFSPLLLKQKLKGKGVICKDTTNESIEPQRSIADVDEKLSSQKLVISGAESSDDGINLREWLNSSGCRINKYKRLHIFKQILEFVDSAHSQGVVLQDLRPSCFILLPSSKVKYIGSLGQAEDVTACNVTRKRLPEEDKCSYLSESNWQKQRKLSKEIGSLGQQYRLPFIQGWRNKSVNRMDFTKSVHQNGFSYLYASSDEQKFRPLAVQLEEKWYSSPEELNGGSCTFSSNIYSLGVLLFELLCNIESWEVHSTAMSDLRGRILPPKFLSENPMDAGFCLWLLHPEPSSRPNTRTIIESEFIREKLVELNSENDVTVSDDDEAETEQLLHFLISLREEKQKQTSKLTEELSCLDGDIKEVERRYSFGTASLFSLAKDQFHLQDPFSSDISRSIPRSSNNEARFMRNIGQLETAYFSMRSQLLTEDAAIEPCDKDVLKSKWRLSQVQNDIEEHKAMSSSSDCLGSFFEGLCKFARYSKFEELGTLRNRDLLSSANVICALSFDRDEDYIAAAGVSKKIKIFDVSAILSDSIDIQYPIVEMSNKSKLSCVCWNSYIKNHLASTDYDGVVQMWDAETGHPFLQYTEHQKRAWSIHFSQSDLKMFASGSDDCSVKLWNISERNSVGTIWNPANVCCVQFSAYSTHLLVFGSADYKIYGYDLRHTRIPWCTLSGHGKAVSFVKFLDSETIASASTDNSLKLWDLKKTSSSGLSSGACGLTFKGHNNEKNFVGLSVLDGYIACGSETNEVYCYHRSLPVPITSHKFGSIDPISGNENNDDNGGQFVSSVCWRKKSNMLVAANSIGVVKLLKLV